MSDKYQRSYHLPWSPGGTSDDKRMLDVSGLLGDEIVITEKMDGGNGCMTRKAVYSRSHARPTQEPWWSYVKREHARCRWDIPEMFSVFGENVYPLHSIRYDDLPGPFLVFNIRDDSQDVWLGWDDVATYAECLGLPTVPVLWRGTVSSVEKLEDLTTRLSCQTSAHGPIREGVVVRVAGTFRGHEFSSCLAKWVRENHVQTDQHWSRNWQPQPCFA